MEYLSSNALELALLAAGSIAYWQAKKQYEVNPHSDVGRLKKPSGAHWLWGDELRCSQTANDELYVKFTEELAQVFALRAAVHGPDILALADPAAVNYIYATSTNKYKRLPQSPISRGISRCSSHPAFSDIQFDVISVSIWRAAKRTVSLLMETTESNASTLHFVDLHCAIDLTSIIGLSGPISTQSGLQPLRQALAASSNPGSLLRNLVLPAFHDTVQDNRDDSCNDTNRYEDLEKKPLYGTSLCKQDLCARRNVASSIGLGAVRDMTALIILELARDMKLQGRLRMEIVQFVDNLPDDERPKPLELHIPLLDAVCKEALRLHPLQARAVFVAAENDVLPLTLPLVTDLGVLTSLKVQKGQIIHVSSKAVNCNRTIWGPDAHEFHPDRWLEPGRLPPSACLTSGVHRVATFGLGRRACPGTSLADFALKAVVMSLIEGFEFRAAMDYPQYIASYDLHPCALGTAGKVMNAPVLVRSLDSEKCIS